MGSGGKKAFQQYRIYTYADYMHAQTKSKRAATAGAYPINASVSIKVACQSRSLSGHFYKLHGSIDG